MGCAACTEACGSEKDNLKVNSDFLQIAKNKVMFLKKALSKEQEKKLLYEFFSEEELNMMLHLMSMEDELQLDNILLLEAGEKFYLSETRKTLWKLYSLDLLAYEFAKNPTIHKFTEDFTTIKISDKIEQRFYEISLDVNRTYPLIKSLDKNHLTLVLKNLTIFFEGVGYTQGMNFIVGFFLLCGFEPKEAYWMFIHLSFNQNFLLIRNFSEGFKNPMFIIKVFEEFMDRNEKLRKLREKLEMMGLNGFIYSFSWFLCYFLYSLEPKCCVLVWDFLLTYNPNRFEVQKNSEPLNETKKAIVEKSEYEMEEEKKEEAHPEYFSNILSHRGSIISLVYLACEVMDFLEEHVNQCEALEEIMKIFRNESLMEKITPEIMMKIIQKIKKRKSEIFEEPLESNWNFLVGKMKTEDKQLYEIYVHESGHRNFMEECLGLRRSSKDEMESKKLKIKSKG